MKRKKIYLILIIIVIIMGIISGIILVSNGKKDNKENIIVKYLKQTALIIKESSWQNKDDKNNETVPPEDKQEIETETKPNPEPETKPEVKPDSEPEVPSTPEVPKTPQEQNPEVKPEEPEVPSKAPVTLPGPPEEGISLAEYVQNLHVVGIGDSVMLGAINSLQQTFPNGYFDGKVSRQIIHAYDIITSLKNTNSLGEPLIINLGANCYYDNSYKRKVIDLAEGREVFWLTVTDDYKVNINESLRALGEEIPNLHIIDWEAISAGHPEYFAADGLHLTGSGQVAYTNAIYSAISNFYLQKYPELGDEN